MKDIEGIATLSGEHFPQWLQAVMKKREKQTGRKFLKYFTSIPSLSGRQEVLGYAAKGHRALTAVKKVPCL